MNNVSAPNIITETADQIAQNILTQFVNLVNTRHPDNPITEFGPATITAQLAGAMSLDVYSNYVVANTAIPALKPAFFAILGTTKQDATKATCDITFHLDSPQIIDIQIPLGTKVSTNDEALINQITYITTEAGTILAGDLSVTVSAQASLAGVSQRIKSNVLTRALTSAPYITEISNTASQGGYDEEDDYQAAERLQGIMQTYYVAASPSSYEALAEQVQGVYRAKCYRGTDYFAPEQFVAGHSTIIIQGDSEETDELLDDVFDYLDDKRTAANYTHVRKPSYIDIDITCDVRIHTYSLSVVTENISDKVLEGFKDWEWQKNITPTDIRNLILSAEGVVSCRLTEPSDVIQIGKFGLPKLNSLVVNQWV